MNKKQIVRNLPPKRRYPAAGTGIPYYPFLHLIFTINMVYSQLEIRMQIFYFKLPAVFIASNAVSTIEVESGVLPILEFATFCVI